MTLWYLRTKLISTLAILGSELHVAYDYEACDSDWMAAKSLIYVHIYIHIYPNLCIYVCDEFFKVSKVAHMPIATLKATPI